MDSRYFCIKLVRDVLCGFILIELVVVIVLIVILVVVVFLWMLDIYDNVYEVVVFGVGGVMVLVMILVCS